MIATLVHIVCPSSGYRQKNSPFIAPPQGNDCDTQLHTPRHCLDLKHIICPRSVYRQKNGKKEHCTKTMKATLTHIFCPKHQKATLPRCNRMRHTDEVNIPTAACNCATVNIPTASCTFATSNVRKMLRGLQLIFCTSTWTRAFRNSGVHVLFATAAYNYSTSELQKVLRRLQFFNIFTAKCASFSTCSLPNVFSPQQRTIIRHQNCKKCSEDYSFSTFSLPKVLFATAAYNCSTSERPKVLRRLQFFNIFTSKCAFRHSRVHFFNISTSKSGPNTSCFEDFDFQMCLSPQPRAIFRHLKFKKCSRIVSFLTCSLPNVVFATAAYNFSTSELQEVLRTRHVLYIFTSECAFRHSGVQFLMSPLTTYLRTRRFNGPTFRLTRRTNH